MSCPFDETISVDELATARLEIETLKAELVKERAEVVRLNRVQASVNSMSEQISRAQEVLIERLEEYRRIIYSRDAEIKRLKSNIESLYSKSSTEHRY